MKKLISIICLFVTITCQSQAVTEHYFPYPEPPEELENLTDRTNYLVTHFWDRCNLNSAILNKEKFKGAFIDYVSFMPYADADVSHKSIDGLIEKFQKDPENLLTLAEIAEATLYNDEGDFVSDELFLPFAKAVANHKKIPSAQKARLAHEAKILEQSQVGMVAPEIEFTRPDGSKGRLSEINAAYILIFFNDPDCDECNIARVRLSADININQLIDEGYLKVVSIYPDEADKEWQESASNYNERWIVGAAPDVDEHYDMRNSPVIYYLNPRHKILSKTLVVDNLLEAFRQVNNKIER